MGRENQFWYAKRLKDPPTFRRRGLERPQSVVAPKPLSPTVAGSVDTRPSSPAPTLSRVVIAEANSHPYHRCFYGALEKLGVRLVDGTFSFRWLMKNLNAGEYLHLHWPSFHYSGTTKPFGVLLLFVRFVAVLLLVRMRGAKLLWTAHNLMPHVPTPIPGMDWLGRRIVIGLSHRVFVHGASAGAALEKRFPQVSDKLALLQHGHWIDYYPHTRSKSQARSRLGIRSEAYVFLFIGWCKEYKNVDGLIKAFRQLPFEALLIIAGKFQRDEYRKLILAMAEGDQRIKVYPCHVPDEELQDFLGACDCVVLPYFEILTSGAAMLALSFGRPVVSVKMGCLMDVVANEVGVLFDPNNPDGLQQALIEVKRRCFDEQKILAHARGFSWNDSARSFIEALDP